MNKDLFNLATRIKNNKFIFNSDKFHNTDATPIGLGLNHDGEMGVLFDQEEYVFTKLNQFTNNTCIITDIKIKPYTINHNNINTDLVEKVFFKDIHKGAFDSFEEFDDFFMNPDSILIL